MELHLLEKIVTVFGLSLLTFVLFNRLKLSPIVGFLLTGVIAGPYGMGLISSQKEIETLAEIGIVLLLFVIGMEFSLHGILKIKRIVIIGGAAQVILTALITFLVTQFFSLPTGEAILLGFLVSLSSTAIVLKVLQDRAEIDSIYGRTAFGILLFQDIAIVPLMLFVPLLAQNSSIPINETATVIVKGLLTLIGVVVAAWYIVPRLLDYIAKTKNREIFLLTLIVICFSVAFVSHKSGLSLALGALLAGLIISESEYSNQAHANVLPFQQIFTILFFVSVGLLLNVQFAIENLSGILLATIVIILVKVLVVVAVSFILGYSLRVGIIAGLSLAQVGEFSFILAQEGLSYKVISDDIYQAFLAVSVLTICVTPLLIHYAAKIANFITDLPLPKIVKLGFTKNPEPEHLLSNTKISDHILIIGYGVNGQLAAKAADKLEVPYRILDLNPVTVKRKRDKGHPINYGDATHEAVLHEERVHAARAVVISISDPIGTRQVVSIVRSLNPKALIIARTRLVSEASVLESIGASLVIVDEFEAALELSEQLLSSFLAPREKVIEFLKECRANSYIGVTRN